MNRRKLPRCGERRFTSHSPRDVEAILEAHYLGGRVELAEQAMMKLEARYGKRKLQTELQTGLSVPILIQTK